MLSRKVLLSFITFFIVFSFVEAVAYVGSRLLAGRGVFYRAPDGLLQVGDYFERRDPALGWPPPDAFGDGFFDVSGARLTPAFPETGRACLSVYGDSFTQGGGVSNEAAWPNQLSRLLGCRVANYGVGGYGSDQATLRFEHNLGDEAPVVILGHQPENIMRNVNQYRELLGSSPLGLKPRFILDSNGELSLVSMPVVSLEEFDEFLARPEDWLHEEFFLPGGASGVSRMRFPFTLSMLRGLSHYHVQAKLAGRPAYSQFYEADHPARGLEITARILERFATIARERGKRPMLQILPTGLDMIEYQETGEWPYAPLLERAAELGLDVVDHGSRLMTLVGEGDPCQLYLACNNHMNPKGNAMLARQVAAALEERRLR